jgi:hypothetical protein
MVEKYSTGKSRVFVKIPITDLVSSTWMLIFKNMQSSLTDPKSRNKTFIYGSAPDKILSDDTDSSEEEIKAEYPIIIVNNTEIPDSSNITDDSYTKELVINIMIDILSDRNDYLDVITDDIINILYANETFYSDCGLYDMVINTNNNEPELKSAIVIKSRSINVKFNYYRN